MTYVYQSPEDKGFQLISVSNKTHKKFFPEEDKYTKIHPVQYIEYYYSELDDQLITQRFMRKWAVCLGIVVFLIPSILGRGIPETFDDIKRSLFERKYGQFYETSFYHIKKHKPEVYEYIKGKTSANLYV